MNPRSNRGDCEEKLTGVDGGEASGGADRGTRESSGRGLALFRRRAAASRSEAESSVRVLGARWRRRSGLGAKSG